MVNEMGVFEVHGVAQLQVRVPSSGSSRERAPMKREAGSIESKIAWNLTRLLLLLLLSLVSPLCRVSTLIFLRQTMSLGNNVLQLF